MTRMHWIILFWLFIGGMLLWQFVDYNQSLDTQTVNHPVQEHFFYYDTNAGQTAAPPAPARIDGPNPMQIAYRVELGKPTASMFTAYATIQNKGNAKATGVQLFIQPWRGAMMSGEDANMALANTPRPDSDPIAQEGQWVYFPDLAPGESAEESAVFIDKVGTLKGENRNPQIIFGKEKASP